MTAQSASPKTQAWRCPSQGRRHTQRDTRKHTHALPEVDKNQPTNTKCRRRRRSTLTSCCREDRMPTPGHCHFHSAPGTSPGRHWLVSLLTAPSSEGCLPLPPLASSPPPKCGNAKTIRVKPNRGELGPAGSPNVPETGVRTCPSRAERLRASSPPTLGAALASRPALPRLAVLTRDVRPGSPPGGQGQCGAAGLRGLRTQRRSRRCRAARPTAAALLCPASLRPLSCLPMGAVRVPPPAASGAGPWKPVGNRVPIGPPDNRSASGQPIRDGGHRSGAFGVGLKSDNRRTLGTRAVSPPAARGRRGSPTTHAGIAFPLGSGGAAWRERGKAAEARRLGNSEEAPNKAALGGQSGLRLLPQ